MGMAFLQTNCGLPASAADIEQTPLLLFGKDIHQPAKLEDTGIQFKCAIANQVIVCPSLYI
jgi:hypothetical protein